MAGGRGLSWGLDRCGFESPQLQLCLSVRGIVTNTPDQEAYRTDRDFSWSWGLEVQGQGTHQYRSITLGCSPAGLGLWEVLIAPLIGCGLWPLLLGLVLWSLCRGWASARPQEGLCELLILTCRLQISDCWFPHPCTAQAAQGVTQKLLLGPPKGEKTKGTRLSFG